MEEKTYIDSFLGIPQGSVCSPLLFNIYMHEFDIFMQETFPTIVKHYDKNSEKSNDRVNTKEYNSIRHYRGIKNHNIKVESKNKTILSRHISTLISTITENIHQFQQDGWNEIIQRGIKYVGITRKLKDQDENDNIEILELKSKINDLANDLQKNILFTYYINKTQKEATNLTLQLKSTPCGDISRSKILIYYHRYADDWTLWIRGETKFALFAKNIIKCFLKEKLDLNLSEEKTKITNLRKGYVKFLGFYIYIHRNIKRTIIKKFNTSKRCHTGIRVEPDRSRLNPRFQTRGFLRIIKYWDKHDVYKPAEVKWLSVFEIQQIIEKFNQFLLGFGNYYITVINEPSKIGKYIYLLYYSCLKTLAQKLKISTKELTIRYGYYDISKYNYEYYELTNKEENKYYHTDLRICHKYTFDGEEKWIVLLNYKELMSKLLKYREKYMTALLSKENENILTPNIDFFSMYKINFRTRYKMTSHCAICGSTEQPLHNHHIKKLKHKGNEKYKGYKAFDKVIASLNRKQITVCENCHNNIHQGKYNNIKLIDIYDVRLAIPENYIKIDEEYDMSTNKRKNNNNKIKFIIDERNRTYFNFEYHNYLIKQKLKKETKK